MFHLMDFLRTSVQKAASQVGLRDCSQDSKKEPGCVGFCNKNQVVRNIKRLLLIKGNQTSELNEFSAFLCSGFNMPANLENSTVATGLEKVSFHCNPKERQSQRKAMPKNAQTTAQLHSSHTLVK